jgi:cell pole-organizing protein PopZ
MTPAVNAVEPKISEGAEQILSEVRAKLDRQLSASRGEVAERAAAPLGLKSIRDAVPAGKPAVDANAARKPVANGLVARTAAAVGGPDGLGLNGTRLERPPAYSSPPTGSSLFRDAAASRPAVSEATKRETRSSPVMFDEQAEKVASAEQAGGNTAGSEAALTGAAPITAGGRTLDDVVADMLRPMLRQWLDENLPGMIEKALREEMAKTGRKGDKPARA